MDKFTNMITSIVTVPSRLYSWIIGGIAGVMSPTIPFIAICMFAIVVDCISAWRLSRRAMRNHPDKKKDAKFRSEYAKRIFSTLYIISMCILLCYMIDTFMFPFMELHLANWISGAFAFVQLLSVLENESSENDATWAKTLQKVLINKVSRHLDIDESLLKEETNNKKEEGK